MIFKGKWVDKSLLVFAHIRYLFRPPPYIANHPTNKCYSKVKILPEYFLPEPLKCIDMGSLNRFRDIPSMQDKFQRYQLTSTPWPLEACQEYSYEDIVEKARKKLEIHKIDTMPKCPIQLSFWLVRNLHLTEKMMRLTFLTDSVNTRLQLIGTTLKQESLFYCRYCNSSLAYCSDLFAMSKHGVQTQYCNSGKLIKLINIILLLIFCFVFQLDIYMRPIQCIASFLMPSATVESHPLSLVGFLATNGTLLFANFVHSMWVGNSRRWSRIWHPKCFLAWLGQVFALEKPVNVHPQTAAHMWYAIFFVSSPGNLNEVGDR